jgi:hypothetical protein
LDDNQETSRDRKKTNGNYGPFSSSATKRTPVKPVEGKDFARKLKNAVSYYNK